MQIVIRVDDVPNNLGDVRVEMSIRDPHAMAIGRSDDDVRQMVSDLLMRASNQVRSAYRL